MNEFNSTIGASENAFDKNQTVNLDMLRSFVAICETGTFRRAADRVHRSPSAISLQIGKLEAQMGAKLMNRDARHIELTEQGEVLLSYARRLLGINDEALSLFRGSSLAGHLRLAAPHDLGVSIVPELLRKLADSHPNCTVDVRLDTSDSVQRLFTSGDANIALFNEIKAPSFKVQKIASEQLVWVMRDGGRAVEHEPLPLAIAEIGCAWRDAALKALESKGLAYRIAYSSDTSMGQIAALRADLAIAALPKSICSNELVEVPKEYDLPPLPLTHAFLADDGSDLASVLSKMATRK